MAQKILIVDDDPMLVRLVEHHLGKEGFDTDAADCGRAAFERLAAEEPDALILDLMLPDYSGTELLARFQQDFPELPVVILTGQSDLKQAVECMRLGAQDYVQKPFDRTRLTTSIRNACAHRRLRGRVASLTAELRSREGMASVLGGSEAMQKTRQLIERAAASDVTVLLQGASGTGKEVAARAIHAEGDRRSGPFVAVNCGAIPEGLIESELFGHEKGAFTGADETRLGSFERADGGTLFLDEVTELRADLQVTLLRALQERVIQRVGGSGERAVDCRVLAATNKPLKEEAASGRFREDLYYRLAVFPIELPPLCERDGDVRTLATAFLERFAAQHGKQLTGFTERALRALDAYAWPGNVRELENVMERATILEDGEQITLDSLTEDVVAAFGDDDVSTHERPDAGGTVAADAGAVADDDTIVAFEEEERRIIARALQITDWNVGEAAARLRLGRATIYRKIDRYGLKANA